jgi:hypothetical protein
VVEVVTCDEGFYPGELPVGLSTLLSYGPPFRPPIGGLVLSLHLHAPPPVPRWPPAEGPACSKSNFHPGEPPWGSARCSRGALIHFWLYTTYSPVLSFSPRAHARPKAAAVGYGEVGLPGALVGAENAVILLPDPCHPAHGRHLSAHIQIVFARSPQIMLHSQAVRMKSLQAAEQPADLAPVRFNC